MPSLYVCLVSVWSSGGRWERAYLILGIGYSINLIYSLGYFCYMHSYLHVTDKKNESQRTEGLGHPTQLSSSQAWTPVLGLLFSQRDRYAQQPLPFPPQSSPKEESPALLHRFVLDLQAEKTAGKVSVI